MTTPHSPTPRPVHVDLAMEEAYAFRSVLDDVLLGTGPVYGEDLRSVFEEGGLGPQGSTLRKVMGAFGFDAPVEGWGEDDDANAASMHRSFPQGMPPTPGVSKTRRVPGSPRPSPAQASGPSSHGPTAAGPTGFAAVLAEMEAAARRLSDPASPPQATDAFPHSPVGHKERHTLMMDAGQATRARHLLYAIVGPFQDDTPRAEDALALVAAKSLGRAITAAFPDLPVHLRAGNIVVSYQDGRKETYGEGPDGSHGLLSVRESLQAAAAPKAMPAHPRPGAGYPKKRRPSQDER